MRPAMAAQASATGPVQSPTARRMAMIQPIAPMGAAVASTATPSQARQAAGVPIRTTAIRPSTSTAPAIRSHLRSATGRLQFGLFTRIERGHRRVLAQLQGADIGGDGPAVGRRHAVADAVHGAVASIDRIHDLAVAEGPL